MTIRKHSNVAAGLAAGIAASALLGSAALADEATESRDLEAFTRVELDGAADIDISVGESQSVTVTTESRLLSKVTTVVRGDTLYLSQDFDNMRDWNDADLTVEISIPLLTGLEIDGAGDVDIRGATGDFEVDVAGAGDISIDGYDGGNFDVLIRGAGDLAVSGSCDSASYRIDGAGDIEAEDLKCRNVSVTINGAGDADINASESVDATINGVGDITISGDPDEVKETIDGFGDIVERS